LRAAAAYNSQNAMVQLGLDAVLAGTPSSISKTKVGTGRAGAAP
jgi:hypothetical protein